MADKQTILEKCYKDRHGRVVIVQKPNLPISVWAVSTVLGHFFACGSSHTLLALVAFGALFTWAWLELFSGANYLRRLLGLMVMIAILYSRI